MTSPFIPLVKGTISSKFLEDITIPAACTAVVLFIPSKFNDLSIKFFKSAFFK